MAFALIKFLYEGKQYTMGPCVLHANAEECKKIYLLYFKIKC